MDVHDQATRSRNMAAIKSHHTKPEMLVRRAMHAAGLRYRLHVRDFAGKPDLVFPKHRAVVFVHGCFWHRHDCNLFRWPATRREFWEAKINRNVANDDRAVRTLHEAGWRVATLWECALKGPSRLHPEHAMRRLSDWIQSEEESLIIRGG